MDAESDSDSEYVKPAKKKVAIGDFFDKLPAGPSKPIARKTSDSTTARKASGSKSAPPKKAPLKKKASSDEELDDYDSPPVPERSTAPKRTARVAPKKYIEVLSDDDGVAGEDKDDSMFEDD